MQLLWTTGTRGAFASPCAPEQPNNIFYSSSVTITPDGKAALLRLARGDMRRVLNVLQACYAAYEKITENEVYACTGAPHPADIETIVNSMLGDEFTTAYESEWSLSVPFSGLYTPYKSGATNSPLNLPPALLYAHQLVPSLSKC